MFRLCLPVIFLMASACNDGTSGSQAVPAQTADELTSETTQLVSFSDIKPIIDEHCISCHNDDVTAASGLAPSDFTNFEGARPYGSLMPSFKLFADLSTMDQQVIYDWIDNGLTEADYNAGVKSILDENCVSCHPEGAEARKDLPNTNLKIEAVVRRYGSLLPSFGELKGASEVQQEFLKAWIEGGLQ